MNLFETGDITSRKHRNSPASVKANPSAVRKGSDNAAILAIFKRRFQMTSKEVGVELGKELHKFSGRISFLLKEGFLIDSGQIAADGCRLLRITEKGLKA